MVNSKQNKKETMADCTEIIYNICETKAEANVYIGDLHNLLFAKDASDTEVYSWL